MICHCYVEISFMLLDNTIMNEKYMIHHVYICSNLISPFDTQYYDKVEDCTNANHAFLSFSCSTSFILTKQNQFQEGKLLLP
jgi:hypothetical protein